MIFSCYIYVYRLSFSYCKQKKNVCTIVVNDTLTYEVHDIEAVERTMKAWINSCVIMIENYFAESGLVAVLSWGPGAAYLLRLNISTLLLPRQCSSLVA